MSSKGKYIGLNQRIPFEVLDSAIHHFVEKNVIERDFIFDRIREFTSGVNRANKATTYAAQILTRQRSIIEQLKKSLTNTTYDTLRIDDRKALCLSLICLTYPITYELLISLAQGFKVQSQINKKFISEKVMSVYGSNRTVDIAIDALLPMIIELNTIKRDKVSIYSLGTKLNISNNLIAELVVYTDVKLSGSKSILVEDMGYKPWFTYFELSNIRPSTFKTFLSKKDSALGKGYLVQC
jgi:hypothetical protein